MGGSHEQSINNYAGKAVHAEHNLKPAKVDCEGLKTSAYEKTEGEMSCDAHQASKQTLPSQCTDRCNGGTLMQLTYHAKMDAVVQPTSNSAIQQRVAWHPPPTPTVLHTQIPTAASPHQSVEPLKIPSQPSFMSDLSCPTFMPDLYIPPLCPSVIN
eukprot:1161841-Pelagomonas_calceolata.AAC.12